MALKQYCIPLSDKDGWEAALKSLSHSFAHTHAYNLAMAGENPDQTFLYVAEASQFHAICPFTIRVFNGAKDSVSPYGFSGFAYQGSYNGFASEYKQFMAEQGYVAGYVVQHPLVDCAILAEKGEVFWGKHCYLMDVSLPEEKLLANMASDHRSRLRQWFKQEHVVITDKTKLIPSFLQLYPETMLRAGAKESYFFASNILQKLIESPYAFLIGVEQDSKIEAVSLFLYAGNYAEYYLNACSETGRKHARGLIWHAGKWLKDKAVATLNLGCGIHEGDALEEFKQRMGGVAKRFAMLKQVYRPKEYVALCESKGIKSDDRSGFFPGYYKEANHATQD